MFHREILILGIEKIEGGHSAENIKKAVEMIVNKYKFDKSKIKCRT